MSAVRIGYHSQGRPHGLSGLSGDPVRGDADDGARFADALGVAGLAQESATGRSFGAPGNDLDGAAPQRKPVVAHGKAVDAAAALVAAGLAGSSVPDISGAAGEPAVATGSKTPGDPPSTLATDDAAGAGTSAPRSDSNDARLRADPSVAAAVLLPLKTAAAPGQPARSNDAAGASIPVGPSAVRVGSTGDTASVLGVEQAAVDPPAAFVSAGRAAPRTASPGEPAPAPTQTPPADDFRAGLNPAESDAAIVTAMSERPPLVGPAAAHSPVARHEPQPGSLALLSGSLSGATSAGATSDGAGDAGRGASDRDVERGRFAPVDAASATGGGTAAASLGGISQAPALVTAPTAAPGAAAPSAIHDQVAGALVRLAADGSREMVVRLHPAELGDLTVRVAVNGRDVTAWFASPQLQVQNAISEAIGQLHAGLGNAGYNLSGAWVGADASGARQESARPGQPRTSPLGASRFSPSGAPGSRQLSSGMSIYV